VSVSLKECPSIGQPDDPLSQDGPSEQPSCRRRILLTYCVLSGLFLGVSLVIGQEPRPVQMGQTAVQVRQKLGPPARMSRQILFRRHIDQWHYDAPQPLVIEFNCVYGAEPYVCSILQLSPPAH
jgi:hypothetical protein